MSYTITVNLHEGGWLSFFFFFLNSLGQIQRQRRGKGSEDEDLLWVLPSISDSKLAVKIQMF